MHICLVGLVLLDCALVEVEEGRMEWISLIFISQKEATFPKKNESIVTFNNS